MHWLVIERKYQTEMDLKHKTTLLQINQLDNFDEKLKRLGRVSSFVVCTSVRLFVGAWACL